MPSNVEIKAKVKHFEAFKNKAREISASEGNIFAWCGGFYSTVINQR